MAIFPRSSFRTERDTGAVRCWGRGQYGPLGYGNTNNIGDNEVPASAGDVNVGGFVVQIVAQSSHTCALLDTGTVRCWGYGAYGVLGYGNTNTVGDDETPAWAGDVSVGGSVNQLATGTQHTCALLDTGGVRCWGNGEYGQLGYGNTNTIGDSETPASAGDVNGKGGWPNDDRRTHAGEPLDRCSAERSGDAWPPGGNQCRIRMFDFSNITTFDRDLSTRGELVAGIRPAIESVWGYCEKNGISGRTVTLKIRYADFQRITRSHTALAPIASRDMLEQVSLALVASLFPLAKNIRLAGLSLSNFDLPREVPRAQLVLAL